MKRSVDTTRTRARFPRMRTLKQLWKRLLTEDDLEAVEGGGSPKPITTGNDSGSGGCDGG